MPQQTYSIVLVYSLTVVFFPSSHLCGQETAATTRLTEQSRHVEEQIVRVSDNVYTAVGFSVSNVSMIVGDQGVVIIDTGMKVGRRGQNGCDGPSSMKRSVATTDCYFRD